MLDPIDPVFETALRETLARFKQLLRTTQEMATSIERQRIREVVAGFEDYDQITPAALVDLILDAIGGGDLEGA